MNLSSFYVEFVIASYSVITVLFLKIYLF